jgi:hypothetical protein
MAPTVADRRAPGSSGPLVLYGLAGPQHHEGLSLLAVDLERGAEILAAHSPGRESERQQPSRPKCSSGPESPGRRSNDSGRDTGNS